jgi:RNA-directed DNA polymerase
MRLLAVGSFEQYSQDYLHDTLGLFRIPRSRDDLPRAKA